MIDETWIEARKQAQQRRLAFYRRRQERALGRRAVKPDTSKSVLALPERCGESIVEAPSR